LTREPDRGDPGVADERKAIIWFTIIEKLERTRGETRVLIGGPGVLSQQAAGLGVRGVTFGDHWIARGQCRREVAAAAAVVGQGKVGRPDHQHGTPQRLHHGTDIQVRFDRRHPPPPVAHRGGGLTELAHRAVHLRFLQPGVNAQSRLQIGNDRDAGPVRVKAVGQVPQHFRDLLGRATVEHRGGFRRGVRHSKDGV
jgi:hypothetical protein